MPMAEFINIGGEASNHDELCRSSDEMILFGITKMYETSLPSYPTYFQETTNLTGVSYSIANYWSPRAAGKYLKKYAIQMKTQPLKAVLSIVNIASCMKSTIDDCNIHIESGEDEHSVTMTELFRSEIPPSDMNRLHYPIIITSTSSTRLL